MDNSGTTLQNLKEKTFVYAKKAFAVAVDEKIPKIQNILLDENMMIKLGIKPTKILTQRFAYTGNSTRIGLLLTLCCAWPQPILWGGC